MSYLYQWDENNNLFKQIEKYEEFPEAKFVKRNMFYSYKALGCADADWISELLLIKDFKVYILASIEVQNYSDGMRSITFENKIDGEVYNLESIPENKFEYIDSFWQVYVRNR